MPIPIQIRGANGEVDTLILNHTSSGQFFGRTVEFPVTELVFDPDLRLISANNQVNRVLTSTKELEQLASQILLFPSPAQSELSVDFKNLAAKVHQMQIFDAKGSLVQTILIGNNFEKIDISNFLTGMYILKLQTDKGALGKTFVKQ
jgi:hypothetical protein